MPKCGRFSEAEKRGICDNGVDFGKKKNKKTKKIVFDKKNVKTIFLS